MKDKNLQRGLVTILIGLAVLWIASGIIAVVFMMLS